MVDLFTDMNLCRISDIFQRHSSARSLRRPRRHTPRAALIVGLIGLVLSGCDRSPPEPAAPAPKANPSAADPNPIALKSAEQKPSSQPPKRVDPVGVASNEDAPPAVCVFPLPAVAPPAATSLKECPKDPRGTPKMPLGTVVFTGAPQAPKLNVEIAVTLAHQRHGLMFRSQLSEHEGMLFSYRDQQQRHFWMHNTCLALDMIHIDAHNRIVGIVENVPPWNDATRTIPCAAMHVLEVPAGWARRYNVNPGQTVELTTNQTPIP